MWFAVGDQQLHVGIEEPFAPARKAHPALAVPRSNELRALAARLEGAGHSVSWDGPRFYVEDPFGNRLELLAPHADLRVRALRDDERAWARRGPRGELGRDRHRRWARAPPGRAARPRGRGRRARRPGHLSDRGRRLRARHARCAHRRRRIGGALVEALADTARAAGCTRLHVITTNDNLPALRLYQRHGFVLVAVHPDQIAMTRLRKPQISATGHAGIPIRDELELERPL